MPALLENEVFVQNLSPEDHPLDISKTEEKFFESKSLMSVGCIRQIHEIHTHTHTDITDCYNPLRMRAEG